MNIFGAIFSNPSTRTSPNRRTICFVKRATPSPPITQRKPILPRTRLYSKRLAHSNFDALTRQQIIQRQCCATRVDRVRMGDTREPLCQRGGSRNGRFKSCLIARESWPAACLVTTRFEDSGFERSAACAILKRRLKNDDASPSSHLPVDTGVAILSPINENSKDERRKGMVIISREVEIIEGRKGKRKRREF